MNPHQLNLVTGCLAGCSLFLHLLSARNFLPDEEVWMLGSVFWYIHYWLNFVARGSLLGAAVSIAIDVQKQNFITDFLSISRRQFKLYLTKTLTVATLSIFIRFIMPGPIASFSFFYKLSFVCALCGMIVTVVEDGGAGMMSLMSPIKRRLGVRKKNHSKDDQEEDQEMKLKRRSGSGSLQFFFYKGSDAPTDSEREPLLGDGDSSSTSPSSRRVPSNSYSKPTVQESDRTPLLNEHDKTYSPFGERWNQINIPKHQSVRTRSPSPKQKLERHGSLQTPDEEPSDTESIDLPPTKRQLTAMELLQTETTYIRNLKIIVEVYKQPLEKAVEDGHPILAMEDIKNIFNGIPDILSVHTEIHQELSNVISDWHEDCCIANIITKYQSQLTTAYPPYVNFFDMGKDLILTQKKSNLKFAEFITNCFNNPLCLKQPIDALMIRPVQRLPSMLLLISDLQRRTPEEIHDYKELEKAKESLKQVLSHINEDKRKTEGKLKIFDIIYEVEACPPEIVAFHRSFVARSNVTSLNEGLYRPGDRLALYLLTDMIEVSKFKYNPENVLLRHVRMLPLDDIKFVIDINDSDESANMFAIQLVDEPSTKSNTHGPHNNQSIDKLCVCQTLDDRVYKQDFLKKLEAQIRANRKKGDNEKVLRKMDHTEVQPMLKRGGSRIFRKGRGKAKRD